MSFLSDQPEEDPESTDTQKGRSTWKRYLATVVVLTAAIGVAVYALQRNGVDVRGGLSGAVADSEDAATTAAVKAAFALSSKVSAFAIDVDTDRGAVRLDGVVPSESIRGLAVAIAEDTAGVGAVEDRLRVEASARPSPELDGLKARITDLEIRAELDDLLSRNPGLAGGDVRVAVDQRNVTLEGTVDTSALKRSVEQVARSVDKVQFVLNEVRVLEEADDAPTTDDATQADALAKLVRFELYASGAFNLDRLQVRTTDGSVTLLGDVRSQAEKLLAERIASDVEGVDDVTNELDVVALPYRAMTSEPTMTSPSRLHRAPDRGLS